jgi:hypothetical protein
MIKAALAVAVLGVLTLQGLRGGTLTFNAVDSGWYQSSTGDNSQGLVGSENYFAGLFPNTNGFDYNNFFVFNVSGVTGTILSATLSIDDSGTGAVVGGPLTFNVGSVADSASSVESTSPSTTIYNDLASGTLYGSDTGISTPGTVLLNLDGAALTALGSAGSGFVFGGYVTPITDGANHYLFTNAFNSSDPSPVVTLSIVTSSASTPEPASVALLGGGLVGLFLLARRRARS